MAWQQKLWILIELEVGSGWPSAPSVPVVGDLGAKAGTLGGELVDDEDMRHRKPLLSGWWLAIPAPRTPGGGEGGQRCPVFPFLPSPSLPQWPLGKALLGSSPLWCEGRRAAQSRHRELLINRRKSHRKLGQGGGPWGGASSQSLSLPCPTLSCGTWPSKSCLWFMGANSQQGHTSFQT